MADQLSGAIEQNIICALCWDPNLAPMLAVRIKADVFSTRVYRKIAEKALAHLDQYHVPPGPHLPDLLERDLKRGDDGALLQHVIESMERLRVDLQATFVVDQLDDFIAARTMTRALEDASDALVSGNLQEAQRALYNASLSVPTTEGKGLWLSNPHQFLGFLEQREEDYFPTGIVELDKRGVRPGRKTIFVFIAPPKRGKTWCLIQIGKQALLHRKKVCHITLENSEELTAKRYTQSLLSMTSDAARSVQVAMFKKDDLNRHTMTIEMEAIDAEPAITERRAAIFRELQTLRRMPLHIKSFPTGTLTVAQLSAYLDYLERVEKFAPDMLIIDYPNLMRVDSRQLRIDLGRIFTDIRGICVARNMAGAVVTQGNRSSATAKTVSGTMVAEDWSIVGSSDTIITYSQTAREREKGLARLLVYGARDAADSFVVLITQAYQIGQFALDSAWLSKYIQEEVQRVTGDHDDTVED